MPDILRALIAGESPLIRSPASIRPWQHVLEALGGYPDQAARDNVLQNLGLDLVPSSLPVAALSGAAVLAVVSLSANIGHISDMSKAPGLRELSKLMFARYVFPFELVSLVLVAAMIGAIVLATRERERL